MPEPTVYLAEERPDAEVLWDGVIKDFAHPDHHFLTGNHSVKQDARDLHCLGVSNRRHRSMGAR